MKRQYEKNHIKCLARDSLRGRLESGTIIKPDSCSECGIRCNPEGHHKDYAKRDEVVWLCRSCHNKIGKGKLKK